MLPVPHPFRHGPPRRACIYVSSCAAQSLKAIDHGLGVYFVRAYDLLEDPQRAQSEHRDRRLRVYVAPRVLVIDEFGVWAPAIGGGHRAVHPYRRALREGPHHPSPRTKPSPMGEVLGDPFIATAIQGPTAASQPRAEHPWRELPTEEKKRAWLLTPFPLARGYQEQNGQARVGQC